MKADQWSGLVTKASPYILPPGAAVEQVNLSPAIPGQLTSRDGMRRVACVEDSADVLDCFPVDIGGESVLLALRSDGSLVALRSPAYGSRTAAPSEPPLALIEGQTGATYTNRFVIGPSDESEPEPPGPDAYVDELYGGSPLTASWPYLIYGGQHNSLQSVEYYGGTPSTEQFQLIAASSLPTP